MKIVKLFNYSVNSLYEDIKKETCADVICFQMSNVKPHQRLSNYSVTRDINGNLSK